MLYPAELRAHGFILRHFRGLVKAVNAWQNARSSAERAAGSVAVSLLRQRASCAPRRREARHAENPKSGDCNPRSGKARRARRARIRAPRSRDASSGEWLRSRNLGNEIRFSQNKVPMDQPPETSISTIGTTCASRFLLGGLMINWPFVQAPAMLLIFSVLNGIWTPFESNHGTKDLRFLEVGDGMRLEQKAVAPTSRDTVLA